MITKQGALSAAVESSTGTVPSGEEVGKDMFELSVEGCVGRSFMRGAGRKHTRVKALIHGARWADRRNGPGKARRFHTWVFIP